MPSKYEGFGLTAIESLILNKPVLNSGVDGLGEIFKYNQELICKNLDEYINKIHHLDLKANFKTISYKYTNQFKWKKEIISIYEK